MSDYKFTEAQEAWLQKLESDEMQDKQGRGKMLDREGKMCCLGVFCSIQPDVERYEMEGYFNHLSYKMQYALSDPTLQERLGIVREFGKLKEAVVINDNVTGKDITYYTLVDLNDVAGWSFKKIASYIRANPRNVFWGKEYYVKLPIH